MYHIPGNLSTDNPKGARRRVAVTNSWLGVGISPWQTVPAAGKRYTTPLGAKLNKKTSPFTSLRANLTHKANHLSL